MRRPVAIDQAFIRISEFQFEFARIRFCDVVTANDWLMTFISFLVSICFVVIIVCRSHIRGKCPLRMISFLHRKYLHNLSLLIIWLNELIFYYSASGWSTLLSFNPKRIHVKLIYLLERCMSAAWVQPVGFNSRTHKHENTNWNWFF